VRFLAARVTGERLSTELIPRVSLRAGQQQPIVYIERVSGVDPAIAVFLEKRASVPPYWKVQYPGWLAILTGANVNSFAISGHGEVPLNTSQGLQTV
jgi:hypothetical protein